MIGNDIVDLDLAKIQSNWRRKGYLEKIFTSSEQALIECTLRPDETVWILWSMKEAVYKIHNRKTGIRNFAPATLHCKLIYTGDTTTGSVSVDQKTYFTESQVSKAYVHTIASSSLEKLQKIAVKIYVQPAHPVDYKRLSPDCVSHHGRYLALVYE